jgi:4-aminobutyrate aminotransferase-like enzyme
MTPALTINSPPSPSPTPLPKTTPYLNGVSNTIPNGIYNHNHPIEEEEQLILHRTPWIPPTAISGNGIYVGLKDGRNVIDAVGGAAVGCLGNGHPEVIKAIKEQAEKLAYVYNMQLTVSSLK